MPRQSATGRQTAPGYYDPVYSNGGLGVVPRRGFDPATANYLAEVAKDPCNALRSFAECAPLYLLRLLMEDSMAAAALDNDLSLGIGQGFRIVAHKDYKGGQGTIDDDGTGELSRLWTNYDPSGGYADALMEEGLLRIASHAGERINDTGEFMFDAVLGKPREGIVQIYDAEPLTFRYKDDKTGNKRVLEQKQRGATDGGWKLMDPATLFTNAWRSSTSNPHGKPRYGAWLNRGLAKKTKERNYRDWMQAVAWPRLWSSFNFEAAQKYAEDDLKREQDEPDYVSFLRKEGGGYIVPYDWAVSQREAYQALLSTLNSSDILVIDSGSKMDSINPASLAGLAEVWKMDRIEDAQALLQMAILLGINEGGALSTSAEVLWRKYTLSLNRFRSSVAGPLCALGNMHFRDMGIDMVAVPEFEPIPPIDELGAVNAQRAKREEWTEQCVMGIIGVDELAIKLSKTGAADKEALNAYIEKRRAATTTTPPTNPAANPGGNQNQ